MNELQTSGIYPATIDTPDRGWSEWKKDFRTTGVNVLIAAGFQCVQDYYKGETIYKRIEGTSVMYVSQDTTLPAQAAIWITFGCLDKVEARTHVQMDDRLWQFTKQRFSNLAVLRQTETVSKEVLH